MTGFGQQVRRSVEKEEAEQLFKTRTEQFKDQSRVVQFENVLECSLSLQLVCPLYVHSPYQSFVAATVISSHSQTRVVEMPTGSGKTWVYAIIAKYYSKQGKSTAVIVPSEILRA